MESLAPGEYSAGSSSGHTQKQRGAELDIDTSTVLLLQTPCMHYILAGHVAFTARIHISGFTLYANVSWLCWSTPLRVSKGRVG